MLPLALPRQSDNTSNNIILLAGDIGGTKTNLGLYRSNAGRMELLTAATFPSRDFTAFYAIIQEFLKANPGMQPERLSVGVAGPVIHGKVETTNLPWKIDAAQLLKDTGVKEVALINDLEATAYGLAGIEEKSIQTLHPGKDNGGGNIAILAPGTGLGEAGLYWDGKAYNPFPTEGGHCFFAPDTENDIALLRYLQKIHGQVSWEHVASGPAIHSLYEFLRDDQHLEEPDWLKDQVQEAKDPSALISMLAVQKKSSICMTAMEYFVRFVARESCNLALKMKATGGIFLGGGIPPKIVPLLQSPFFYQSFLQTDRMLELIENVPVKIILDSKAALMGAAYFGAFGTAQQTAQ